MPETANDSQPATDHQVAQVTAAAERQAIYANSLAIDVLALLARLRRVEAALAPVASEIRFAVGDPDSPQYPASHVATLMLHIEFCRAVLAACPGPAADPADLPEPGEPDAVKVGDSVVEQLNRALSLAHEAATRMGAVRTQASLSNADGSPLATLLYVSEPDRCREIAALTQRWDAEEDAADKGDRPDMTAPADRHAPRIPEPAADDLDIKVDHAIACLGLAADYAPAPVDSILAGYDARNAADVLPSLSVPATDEQVEAVRVAGAALDDPSKPESVRVVAALDVLTLAPAVLRRLDEALGVLAHVEWAGAADEEDGGTVDACPWCGAAEGGNHDVGCLLADAIGSACDAPPARG